MAVGDLVLGRGPVVGTGHLALGYTIFLHEVDSASLTITASDIDHVPATLFTLDTASLSLSTSDVFFYPSKPISPATLSITTSDILFGYDQYEGSLVPLVSTLENRTFNVREDYTLTAHVAEPYELTTYEDRDLNAKRDSRTLP